MQPPERNAWASRSSIIFEATELLVVKGAEASGACSFDDEVASDAEEEGGDD